MTDTADAIARARAGIEALRGLVPDSQIELMLAQLPAAGVGVGWADAGGPTVGVGWADVGGPTADRADGADELGFVPHPNLQTPADARVRDDAGTHRLTQTDGGALVGGAVQVRGGHFIGRDLIQFVTQVVRRDERPEDAHWAIGLYLESLAGDLAGLRFGEVDAGAADPRRELLELPEVYVPLDTTLWIPKDTTLADWLARPAGGGRRSATWTARPLAMRPALGPAATDAPSSARSAPWKPWPRTGP